MLIMACMRAVEMEYGAPVDRRRMRGIEMTVLAQSLRSHRTNLLGRTRGAEQGFSGACRQPGSGGPESHRGKPFELVLCSFLKRRPLMAQSNFGEGHETAAACRCMRRIERS